MNPFSLIPSGYLILTKVIASVLLIIALYAAWHSFTGHYIDIGRAEVQKTFDAHLTADRKADAERKAGNLAKDTKSKIQQDSIVSNHTTEINQIRAKYDKLNQDKNLADIAIDNWRERLRLELAKAAAGLSDIPATTEGLAISGKDRDTATLRSACEITTADYNTLYSAWANACKIYGCK